MSHLRYKKMRCIINATNTIIRATIHKHHEENFKMQAERVTFQFTVDDEQFSTHEHTLTPTQILQIADRDPATHYLVQIEGNHQVSYKDKPNEPIHMHQHAKFVSQFMGDTPVS